MMVFRLSEHMHRYDDFFEKILPTRTGRALRIVDQVHLDLRARVRGGMVSTGRQPAGRLVRKVGSADPGRLGQPRVGPRVS